MGTRELVEELTVRQRAGERRFASLVHCSSPRTASGSFAVAYSTGVSARPRPVTLRER